MPTSTTPRERRVFRENDIENSFQAIHQYVFTCSEGHTPGCLTKVVADKTVKVGVSLYRSGLVSNEMQGNTKCKVTTNGLAVA